MTLKDDLHNVTNRYITKSKESNAVKLQNVSNALLTELSYTMAFTAHELNMPLKKIIEMHVKALKKTTPFKCGECAK